MESAYLSNLRRAMSAAKTQTDATALSDTIFATQLEVSPPAAMHSAAEVATMTATLSLTRYDAKVDMDIVFRFLQVAGMTAEQCMATAEILIKKHGFTLRNPIDSETFTALKIAELESFEASEALLVAQSAVGRTWTNLQAIIDRVNHPAV